MFPCVEVAVARVLGEIVILGPSVDDLSVRIANNGFTSLGRREVEGGTFILFIFQSEFKDNLVVGLGVTNPLQGEFRWGNLESGIVGVQVQFVGSFELLFGALHEEASFDQTGGRKKLIRLASAGCGIGDIGGVNKD